MGCVQGKLEEVTLSWDASARSHRATSRLLLHLVALIHSQQFTCLPVIRAKTHSFCYIYTVYNLAPFSEDS